jgi:glycogen synthase
VAATLPEKERLHVAFVTPEMAPFVKTGGLADVSGALPKALVRLGHRVTVVLPRYRGVAFPPGEFAGSVHVRSTDHRSAGFYRRAADEVVFIEYPPFFERDSIYGDYPTTAFASRSWRARRSSTSAAGASGRASSTRTTGRPASCRCT